jgi:alpha-L-fucosidase
MTMPLTKLKPTGKQLSFMDWELGLFVHFGIRTFYEGHKDWDSQGMEPNAFAPTALDCSQWLETASRAGCRYAVLTAKHHDGFAVWPTRFSDYSVSATPWKDGKGDVVMEFTDA